MERTFVSDRQQNQLLFAPLESLLDSLGEQKIDTILVGTGPGSYSGSRISIATAQGLAAVFNSSLAGICSFFAIPEILNTKHIAVGDARRGSYFIYEVELNDTSPSPELFDKEDFQQKLAQSDGNKITFEEQNEIPADDVKLVRPTAQNMILYWNQLASEKQNVLKSKPLEPLYLRAPFITKSKKTHPLLGK